MTSQYNANNASVLEPGIDAIEDDLLRQASEIILEARRSRHPIPSLPEKLRPTNLAEAYRLQDILISALGPVGGWKVGAPSPEAEPLCSPMPLLGGFAENNSTLAHTFSRYRGAEAEIAFLLGQDLPVRNQPYTREEVVAAIASAHPAIEIMETAFDDPDRVDRFSVIGDLQMNGGFAHGPALPNWRGIDFAQETAAIIVDGAVRVEAKASNPAGTDLLRLVAWLANEGQSRTGGLSAGDWITTGSWTGKVLASPGSEVIARFSSFGDVRIYFARK
jgi:2-keto-4-pentenoate hydratase